MIDSE